MSATNQEFIKGKGKNESPTHKNDPDYSSTKADVDVCKTLAKDQINDKCTWKSFLCWRGQSWLKVRLLPNGHLTWFKAKDNLIGLETYGNPSKNTIEWSLPFLYSDFT
jgi:hypothetical protein